MTFVPVARGEEEPIGTSPLRERPAVGSEHVDTRSPFVKDEILVLYEGGLPPGDSRVLALEGELGLEPRGFEPVLRVHRYGVPAEITVADAIRGLGHRPPVQRVEANAVYFLVAVPNDPFYDDVGFPTDLQKWVFDGLGPDRNLDGEAAWDLTVGNADVVIAIIDSGIDLDHPDLAANIFVHPGEIAANGIDDDGNGFVDDVNGYDFRSLDADPNPDLGNGIDDDGFGGPDSNVFHGTFAASCAGAVGNNAVGVAGAAWICRLMALKVFTDDGGASSFDIAQAVVYAANEGAHVINMSMGGPSFSGTLQDAVDFAHAEGLVVIASAGNGNDDVPMFPASLNHVISVGASDSGSVINGGSGDIDGRAAFSQFGPAAVDVVAPGVHIAGASVGSVADGSPGVPLFSVASGTSFSAPLVAGLAALILSRAADLAVVLSPDDVEAIIFATAVDLPDDPGDAPDGGADWDGNGRVEFLAALLAVESVPENQAPVADAGPDQEGRVKEPFLFDGSLSFDPDEDELLFCWDFGDGSPEQKGVEVTHVYEEPGTYEVTLTVSDGLLASSDMALAFVLERETAATLLFSSRGKRSYKDVPRADDEDVIALDLERGTFSLYFDGTDVGLARGAVEGLVLLPDGDLLLCLNRPLEIPGLIGGPDGSVLVDDSDVVRFTPSSLGETTAGVFTFHFDGSDVGLTRSADAIDALGLLDGDLVISLRGRSRMEGLGRPDDSDLLLFEAEELGAGTRGTFTLLIDGSDVGLDRHPEDIDGLHVRGSAEGFLLSTRGRFAVPGASGENEDVLLFLPELLGEETVGTFEIFLRGKSAGLDRRVNLSALHLIE
jgi:subtilisin family serine protease